MATLGLLPQAAGLLAERAARVGEQVQRPTALGAEVTMLRSEVELLQHQLALALQRNPQVLAPGGAPGPSAAPAMPAGDAGESGEKTGGVDLDGLRAASTAQLGQDLWVLERSGYKHGGFFVEFGATDGVLLSNSWLLETRMGWRGICAEPNPKYFERLQRNRRCQVSNACIGATTGETVEFLLAEEFGGMVGDMSRDLHAERRQAYYADPSNRVRLVTESLDDLLRRLNAPRDIDYLSIDTEGSELAILSAFPFDRWNIHLLTVEHNFSADRERIHELLSAHGYARTESQWDDWYERRPQGAA
jgi:FkbM family methyltransferase